MGRSSAFRDGSGPLYHDGSAGAGDDGEQQRHIRTVRGFGYRFHEAGLPGTMHRSCKYLPGDDGTHQLEDNGGADHYGQDRLAVLAVGVRHHQGHADSRARLGQHGGPDEP